MTNLLTWILIMTIDTGYSGVSVTAEFNTVEACKEAAKVSRREWVYPMGGESRVNAVCAYKGDAQQAKEEPK